MEAKGFHEGFQYYYQFKLSVCKPLSLFLWLKQFAATLVERSQDFKEKSWVLMNTPTHKFSLIHVAMQRARDVIQFSLYEHTVCLCLFVSEEGDAQKGKGAVAQPHCRVLGATPELPGLNTKWAAAPNSPKSQIGAGEKNCSTEVSHSQMHWFLWSCLQLFSWPYSLLAQLLLNLIIFLPIITLQHPLHLQNFPQCHIGPMTFLEIKMMVVCKPEDGQTYARAQKEKYINNLGWQRTSQHV